MEVLAQHQAGAADGGSDLMSRSQSVSAQYKAQSSDFQEDLDVEIRSQLSSELDYVGKASTVSTGTVGVGY